MRQFHDALTTATWLREENSHNISIYVTERAVNFIGTKVDTNSGKAVLYRFKTSNNVITYFLVTP